MESSRAPGAGCGARLPRPASRPSSPKARLLLGEVQDRVDIDREDSSGEREARGHRARRYARRTTLYAFAGALVALLVMLIALVIANTRTVEVSWVFGSTRQSLVWIILVTAILGWLLGIVTSIVFRYRTRRPRSAPATTSP
jgi:uncharacterized integral membrane protein